jgi:hypothetical protein
VPLTGLTFGVLICDVIVVSSVAKMLSFGRLECRHFCDSGMR